LLVGHPKGIGVQYLRLLHQLVVAPPDGVRLLIHDLIIRELYVVRGEFLSVVPENALAEEEGDDGLRTGLDLPGFCQISDKTVEVPVVLDQTVEDESVDLAGSGVLGQDGVEKGSITDRTDDELVDPQARSMFFEYEAEDQDDEKKSRKDEK
jgi:hypothetical protein